MKNTAFSSDFNKFMHASDVLPRLTDQEVRELDMRDMYNMPMLFGDPLVLVHIPANFEARVREIEFYEFVRSAMRSGALNRASMIKTVMKAFDGAMLLSETNMERASKEYAVRFTLHQHLVVCPK